MNKSAIFAMFLSGSSDLCQAIGFSFYTGKDSHYHWAGQQWEKEHRKNIGYLAVEYLALVLFFTIRRGSVSSDLYIIAFGIGYCAFVIAVARSAGSVQNCDAVVFEFPRHRVNILLAAHSDGEMSQSFQVVTARRIVFTWDVYDFDSLVSLKIC